MSVCSQGLGCAPVEVPFQERRLVAFGREVPVRCRLNANPRNDADVGEHESAQFNAKGLFLMRLNDESLWNSRMVYIHELVLPFYEAHLQFLHTPGIISGVGNVAAQPEVRFPLVALQRGPRNQQLLPVRGKPPTFWTKSVWKEPSANQTNKCEHYGHRTSQKEVRSPMTQVSL